MRPLQHPPRDEISLAAVLYALGDPVRLAIVQRLANEGPLSCTGSQGGCSLPRSTLSRHYDLLRASGVVFTEKLGAQYLNHLRREDLDTRFPGLLSAVLGAGAP